MTDAAVSDGKAPVQLVAWSALVVVYLVWGSTYLAIKVADESIPPLLMAGVRYLVAGVLLVPVVIGGTAYAEDGAPLGSPAASGEHSPRRPRRGLLPSAAELAGCALVGVLMLTGGNGGVSYAEHTVPSGLAALLVASVPLWMVVGDRVLSSSRPSPMVLLALLAGFAGVFVLARQGSHRGSAEGIVIVLLASVSWATGSLLGRRVPQPRRPLTATAFQMLAGGVVLLILAAATGEVARFHPGAVSVRSWLALVYLIGPGSILALNCYTIALRRLPTSTVSTYAYVNPVVAVFLGWAILGEVVSSSTFLGGSLVVLAVALIVAEQRRRA